MQDEEELGKLRNLWDNDKWRRTDATSATTGSGNASGAAQPFDPRPYRENLQKWDPMRPHSPPKMTPAGPTYSVRDADLTVVLKY